MSNIVVIDQVPIFDSLLETSTLIDGVSSSEIRVKVVILKVVISR